MSRKSAKVKLRAEKALSAVRTEKVLSAVRVVAVSIMGGLIGIGLSPSTAVGGSCWPAFDAFIGNPGMGQGNKKVLALALYDDGTGEGLYAGGVFTSAGRTQVNKIARWNEDDTWSDVGGGVTVGDIFALAEFKDELYAGGNFNNAGGGSASNIARWDGQTWRALGSGTNGDVRVLYEWIDPETLERSLYVGGSFTTAGGLQVSNLAKWNGTSWSDVDSGLEGASVDALVAVNFGSGPALYVGGRFPFAGPDRVLVNNLARWDGTTWAGVGGGTGDRVRALTVFHDGQSQKLYVGGIFGFVGTNITAKRIARWDGSVWSDVGGGVENIDNRFHSSVRALTAAYDGTGCRSVLFVGGQFEKAGGALASKIARWDGTNWLPIIENGENGLNGLSGTSVAALLTWPTGPGTGEEVYFGGHFNSGGGFVAGGIARRSCQTCEFDIDNDGQINPVDVGIVQANFGCMVGSGDEWCDRSDVDKDCVVNPVDSGLVQAKFGTFCP